MPEVKSATVGYILVAALAWLVAGWMYFQERNTSLCFTNHGDLLTGYKILRYTLRKESQLNILRKLRIATLRPPTPLVGEFMVNISKISTERGHELEELWLAHEPLVDIAQAPLSVIGDRIQNTAEAKGAAELVSKSGKGFSTRFYFLQAMAIR